MPNDRVETAVAYMLGARKSGRLANALEEPPANRAEALAIQDRIVASLGGAGGWKTAPPQPGKEGVFTPLPAVHLHISPARLTGLWPFKPEIEVEIGVRLTRDLPIRPGAYKIDDLAAAIGSVHPAIEVIGSRFMERKTVEPLTEIADLRGNISTVIGPPLFDWRHLQFATVAIELFFDDEKVAATSIGLSTVEILNALANLATHTMSRREQLREGQIVITGSRIKPPVPLPSTVRRVAAEVSGIGRVEFVASV